MTNWEYTWIRVDANAGVVGMAHELNDLGRRGWEAVGMGPESPGATGRVALVVLLKRPLDD